MSFDVAAYIWPSYHYEPRTEHFWPEGDGEWYTVRRAKPRFAGHDMPRIPLLGEQDEANPAVMREHVELAMAHGVNVFIVDWYWYENAPCFERQLNEGLIPALAGTGCEFYLMWADKAIKSWERHEELFGTYYPQVSVGWDNTHRNPSAGVEQVVQNATPDAFEACLWRARRWLEARPQQRPLVTINSWNEWTEGSYLLPDMRWGYGYLQAVRNVFGK
ncbi:MAG: hypothetical protein GX230_05990 [Lentisphaerae bacterium]|nr:hypothetical protein [Lentisphaerota bacterium]